jgi:hypothetical protein
MCAYVIKLNYIIISKGWVMMIRTQIQLTEQQYSSLKAMAQAQGISMAELIRKSLDNMINSSVKNNERITRAMNAAGRFRSGLKDLSTNHDDYLREVFVE